MGAVGGFNLFSVIAEGIQSVLVKFILVSSFTSAEEVTGNRDILLEILSGLPPKSLLQLKRVSKEWLTLISDYRFRRSHFLRHHPTTLLLTNKFGPISSTHILSFTAATTATVRNLDLDFLNNYSYYVPRHVAVVRSCNGLLLCRIASRYCWNRK
ncbi:hypothetical protein OROGR_000653 [Orobanche gracilis]